MRDDPAEILFQSILQKAFVGSSGVGRYVHSLMMSIQYLLCRPRRRPPSKGAVKDGFDEDVEACDMPDSCEFPSLDGCQKRFLWTHKEVDPAPSMLYDGTCGPPYVHLRWDMLSSACVIPRWDILSCLSVYSGLFCSLSVPVLENTSLCVLLPCDLLSYLSLCLLWTLPRVEVFITCGSSSRIS